MTNPKEKRETLEYKISRLLLTITTRNYRLAKIDKITPELEKEDERTTAIFLEGIKEIIQKAFEETRGKPYTFKEVNWGDGITSQQPVEDDTISFAEAKHYNQALQETIKRQEEYINNL